MAKKVSIDCDRGRKTSEIQYLASISNETDIMVNFCSNRSNRREWLLFVFYLDFWTYPAVDIYNNKYCNRGCAYVLMYVVRVKKVMAECDVGVCANRMCACRIGQ